eukprot:9402087-Heterocapsa_arctica.AAC.1
MVIARMPEDRSKPLKHYKTFKAMYTCMCTPVGPFTLFSNPLERFGSKLRCASDGASDSSPRWP